MTVDYLNICLNCVCIVVKLKLSSTMFMSSTQPILLLVSAQSTVKTIRYPKNTLMFPLMINLHMYRYEYTIETKI